MKIEFEGRDSLSATSDPDILAYATLRQSDRLQASEKTDEATASLAELSERGDLSPAFKSKIESRRDALQGKGSFGANFEILLSRFVRETSRPLPMLAMGAASTCFQLSRLALLAKLPGSLTVLARPTATVAEAGAFALMMPSSGRGLQTDFLSSLILMGSLQASAFPLRFLPSSLSLPAMYGGVLLAQESERRLGWRPSVDGGMALTEALALTMQLHAGAGLTKLALGSEGVRQLSAAELRVQGRRNYWTEQRLGPEIYAMSEGGFDGSNGGRPRLRLVSSDPREEFVQTYSKSRTYQELYHRILSHYGNRHDGPKLAALLMNSGVQHPGVMNPGLEQLTRILVGKTPESDVSYRDWLAQKIYERVYFENRSPLALGEVLKSLSIGESGGALEKRLAPHFPELDLRASHKINTPPNSLQFEMEAVKRFHERSKFEQATSGIPLTDQARFIVFDWKQTAVQHPLGNMQVRIDDFLDRFCDFGTGPRAVHVLEVNDAIEAAGQSPLGVARLSRLESLFRLNRSGPTVAQLEELAD